MADTPPDDNAVASSPSRGESPSPRGSPALNQDQASPDINSSSSPPRDTTAPRNSTTPRESTLPPTSTSDLDSPPPSPGNLYHFHNKSKFTPSPLKCLLNLNLGIFFYSTVLRFLFLNDYEYLM